MLEKNYLTIAALLGLMLAFPNTSQARPPDNQLKFWLGSQKVTVEKKKILGISRNKSEKIDISNIQVLKITGQNTQHNVMTSVTTLTLDFGYLPIAGDVALQCNATITYSWLTAAGPMGKNSLQTVIAKCL